jgi:hypothetical protein
MIKKIFVLSLSLFSIYGCKKEASDDRIQAAPTNASATGNAGRYGLKGSDYEYSASMPIDTANRMILSYLNSVHYPNVDTALRALTFNADSLREYLKNDEITDVKFIIAHQQAYMNSGHYGQYAGMNPQAITLIVVGVSADGGHILNNQNEVYEHFKPCPVLCSSGASSAYIY